MEDLFVRWGKGRDAQTPDKSTDRSREAQSTESRTDFNPEEQPPGGKTGLSRDAKRRPSRRNRRGKEAAQDSDQAKESIGKTRTQRTQDSGGKSRAVLAARKAYRLSAQDTVDYALYAKLGIMLFDREAGTLAPLVYVPAAGTLCWERSCASGTTAVGAYLASAGSPISLSLKQPGGILRIEADPSGDLFLTGTVRLIRRRTVRETE